MANVLPGPTDSDRLRQLSERTYKQQGVWFLNAFWEKFESEAENVWKYVQKSCELDLQKGKEGTQLDEMMAHRFLEVFSQTMTVRQLRETLFQKVHEKPKYISLTHYLICRYDVSFVELVNASQGSNREEIEEAQRRLEAVQAALQEAERSAKAAAAASAAAKASEAEAKRREAAAIASEAEAKRREAAALQSEAEAKVQEATARARETDAKQREAEARAAQQELEAALAELKAQEDAFNNKKADLERKSEEGGVVSRNKAKAELAQHLAEDPLPLRRAKITQEAAVNKADKATRLAAEARAVAEVAANKATEARTAAEEDARNATAARTAAEEDARRASAARAAAEEDARRAEVAHQAAENAVEECRERFQEAEAFLAEARAKPGSAQGALWWIDRELHEALAYMPTAKGGYKKEKN